MSHGHSLQLDFQMRASSADSIRASRFFGLHNRPYIRLLLPTRQHGYLLSSGRRPYKTFPMGIRTGSIPELAELEAYSESLKNVEFYAEDFESVVDRADEGDFIYLDPPYSKPESRKRGEYGPNSFDYSDIERLVNALVSVSKKGVPFVLSYCESDILLSAIPNEWTVERLSVKRHVAGFHEHRRMVGELLISNGQAVAEV